MVTQLLIGSVILSSAIVITAAFISVAVRALTRIGPWLATPPFAVKTAIALTGVSLWLLAAITISIWMWAAAFLWLDLFEGFETSLYFSAVTLTTVGYGDITLPAGWRQLTGMCAANGLLLFGLSAAFLFELFARIYDAQSGNKRPS